MYESNGIFVEGTVTFFCDNVILRSIGCYMVHGHGSNGDSTVGSDSYSTKKKLHNTSTRATFVCLKLNDQSYFIQIILKIILKNEITTIHNTKIAHCIAVITCRWHVILPICYDY